MATVRMDKFFFGGWGGWIFGEEAGGENPNDWFLYQGLMPVSKQLLVFKERCSSSAQVKCGEDRTVCLLL